MISIPFGRFAPGGSVFGTQATEAKNVLPLYGGYYPMREQTKDASVADIPITGAFAHVYPVGAGLATYEGDKVTVIAGTRSALYEVTAASFTNISRGAGYGVALAARPAGWRCASFGNDVWATNCYDPIQRRTNNTGAFADGVTSTRSPIARFIAPVREFMVVTDYADSIYWSDINDATWFDDRTGARPASLAGSKALRSLAGQITGFTGGEFGVIYKRRSTYALQFTGGADTFRLDELSPGIGVALPGSLIKGRLADYFFGGDGFYRRTGLSAPEKISPLDIDQLFTDAGRFPGIGFRHAAITTMAQEDDLLTGFEDGRTGLLFWFYQTSTASGTYPMTAAVVYDPATTMWTRLDGAGAADANLIRAVSLPDTSVLATTDDNLGAIAFRVESGNSVRATFSGPTLAATLRTGRLNKEDGGRFKIKGAMPIFTTPESDKLTPTATPNPVANVTVTIRVSNEPYYEIQADADGTTISPRSESYARTDANDWAVFPVNLEGYWYDVQIDIPAGSSWHSFSSCVLDME